MPPMTGVLLMAVAIFGALLASSTHVMDGVAQQRVHLPQR
jgi:hypothetical protein